MKANKDISAYGTHQPVLIHVMNTITKGDVLEFGMGNYSTKLLHDLCEKQNRKLLSIESDPGWFEKFMQYKNENHDMFVFEQDKLLLKQYDFFNQHFSIAFIDAAPAEIRQPFIKLMKDNVDYFVIHDTEGRVYNYCFRGFKHVLDYKKTMPWTSVVSNLDEINKEIENFG